jgi:hypothetical protein
MKHRVSPFSKCLYLPSPLLTKEGKEKGKIVNE